MSPTGKPTSPRAACALVVAAFAFTCAWFTGFYPPFAIDSQLAVLGDHEDKAAAGGRLYSNKAPGLAFAAIPIYRLLRFAFPAPDSADARCP